MKRVDRSIHQGEAGRTLTVYERKGNLSKALLKGQIPALVFLGYRHRANVGNRLFKGFLEGGVSLVSIGSALFLPWRGYHSPERALSRIFWSQLLLAEARQGRLYPLASSRSRLRQDVRGAFLPKFPDR